MNSDTASYSKTVQGFTLIEVMLAISITAFVATLSYQGLSVATSAAQSHERQVKLLSDIQLPLTVLERDIRHAVARTVKDEFDTEQPALSGGSVTDYVLALTRRGWDNPIGLPRGELQRVRYVLEDEILWRESWSVLDRMTVEGGQRRTRLLEGITELKLAFLQTGGVNAQQSDLGGEWVDEWRSKGLPAAVDITIELKNFGRIRRVFGIQGY